MLTLEKILGLYIPEEFGCDECNDITESMDEVIDALDLDSEEYNYGATKFVIYLNNKEVIKIPFNGEWFYQYPDDNLEEGWFFDPFQYHKGNYCDKEMELYAEAEEFGIEQIFSNIEFVGMSKNDIPIYKSERVHLFCYDENEKQSSKEAMESVRMMNAEVNRVSSYFNVNWLGNAIDYYGEEFIRKVLKFIDKHGLSDFHGGNLAYRDNGAPVIIDYAGFYH